MFSPATTPPLLLKAGIQGLMPSERPPSRLAAACLLSWRTARRPPVPALNRHRCLPASIQPRITSPRELISPAITDPMALGHLPPAQGHMHRHPAAPRACWIARFKQRCGRCAVEVQTAPRTAGCVCSRLAQTPVAGTCCGRGVERLCRVSIISQPPARAFQVRRMQCVPAGGGVPGRKCPPCKAG